MKDATTTFFPKEVHWPFWIGYGQSLYNGDIFEEHTDEEQKLYVVRIEGAHLHTSTDLEDAFDWVKKYAVDRMRADHMLKEE